MDDLSALFDLIKVQMDIDAHRNQTHGRYGEACACRIYYVASLIRLSYLIHSISGFNLSLLLPLWKLLRLLLQLIVRMAYIL